MHSFNMNMGYQNKQVTVELFALAPSGTYQDHYLRPFEIKVTKDNISALQNATRDGQSLGVAAVQSVASDILCPRAQVEGMVGVSGAGWDSKRFRFIMKVTEQNPFMSGLTTQRIFFGTTNHANLSHGGLLDPNTQVYFNSETIINETNVPTPNGVVRQATIAGSNQIVTPVDLGLGGNTMFAAPTAHLCRPEDMFALAHTVQVGKQVELSGLIEGQIDKVIDNRTMVGEGGTYKYSHRRDTAPTRFISDTLGAYSHAVREAALTEQDDDPTDAYPNVGITSSKEQLYSEAYNRVANADIHKNGFLAILKEHAHFMERGFVTVGDIWRLFPESHAVTHYGQTTQAQRRVENLKHQSFHMYGADPKSIASSLIAQVIPSIMMDTFMRQVRLDITNGIGGGNYSVRIIGEQTKSLISHVDMRPHLMELERRLATDALNSITFNNQIPFRITLLSDLASDTVIDIALGGEIEMTRFVYATAMDSLFSPVITRNPEHPANMSDNLLWLMGEVIPTENQQQIKNFMPEYVHPTAQPVQMPQGVTNAIQISEFL